MKQLRTIFFLAVLLTSLLNASAKTFYGRVTVIGDATKGLVAASDGSVVDLSNYAETYTTDFTAESTGIFGGALDSSAEGSVTLMADAKPGYKLSHWVDGSGNTYNSPASLTCKSSKSSSPTLFTLTAVFEESDFSVSSSNTALGSVVCDKADPKIGDKVTLTATKNYLYSGQGFNPRSASHIFDGWFDSDGNLLSAETKYTFTLEQKMAVTGRFHVDRFLTGDGYYRICWMNRVKDGKSEYITLKGDYSIASNVTARTSLSPVLEFHTDPYSPGCIFKVTGTYLNPGDDLSGERIVMKDVVIAGQGLSTADLVSGHSLTIGQGHNFGFNKIYVDGAAVFESQVNSAFKPEKLCVTANHGVADWKGSSAQIENQDPASYFDFQPINEAYVDQFYWGVECSEQMYWDGDYWATMYTSYPYYMYDDIEAYYVSEFVAVGDETVAVFEKIADGKVPANTPVLLKCPGTKASENRMIPSMEDYPALPSNMLRGEFQLNTKNNDLKTAFNANMRVLSTDGETVGFYMLPNGTELLANRAWLDVSSLTAAQAARLKIRFGGNAETGVDAPIFDGAENVIYDLYGRRVREMVRGNIYIVNGKKVLW